MVMWLTLVVTNQSSVSEPFFEVEPRLVKYNWSKVNSYFQYGRGKGGAS